MYEAFKGIGFVSIVNHGLDQRLVDGAFAQARVRRGNHGIENSEYLNSLSILTQTRNFFGSNISDTFSLFQEFEEIVVPTPYLLRLLLTPSDIGPPHDQSKAFFALDAKAKASVAWTSAEANRGYLGVGKEMLCVLNLTALHC
jgi:hypothetical protein